MGQQPDRLGLDEHLSRQIVVSVIIPIFNVENYISACLDSILNQSLSDIEVICVNDGSTDNSLSIVESYGRRDSRVRIWSQSNRGQSAARNLGISEARGQYVYFMDADDLLDRSALELLARIATEERLDVLYFDAKPFSDHDELRKRLVKYERYYKRVGSYESVRDGKAMLVQMVNSRDYKVSPCMQIINTKFLHDANILFYEGIIHEDNLFTLEVVLAARRTRHVGKELFHRRVRPDSTMTSKKSPANVYGCIVCAAQMSKLNLSRDFSSDVKMAVQVQIVRMFKDAVSAFRSLGPAEQGAMRFALGTYESLFLELVKVSSSSSGTRNFWAMLRLRLSRWFGRKRHS